MHARRVSNPRISRPPSPEYHHERTPSAPLLRRAPSPGPHKLHSPFASFAAGRPRSQQRRIIALLVGALTVVVMCVVVFSQLSNIDTRLLDAYHAATRGTRVGAEQEGGVLAVAGTLQEAETSSKPQGLEIEPEELDSDPVEEAEEGSERVLEAGWSEAQQQEEEQQQMDLTNLPPCKRTMVFKMAGLHGFGSEFNLLVRAATLARKYNYTLLPVDSAKWNYGSFSSFFNPPVLDCRPPKAEKRRAVMKFDDLNFYEGPTGVEFRWTNADHVLWIHRDLGGLDRAVAALFTNEEEVQDLHRWDLAQLSQQKKTAESGHWLGLPASDTVPFAYSDIFKAQASTAKKFWRPNSGIKSMIQDVERELELEPVSRPKKVAGDLVIGVHVRLGDKYLEAGHIGPQALASDHHHTPPSTTGPGLHHSTVTSYLVAATEHVFSLLTTSLDYSSADARPTRWIGRPTLVIMSDDSGAWKAFVEHKLGQRFRVVSTPLAELQSEDVEPARAARKQRLVKVTRASKRAVEHEETVDPMAKTGGFHETEFNRLSLAARVALTKVFVRDITLLAKHADALVLTASSNVGRLLLTLAGEKKVTEGRVRSLDTRWFPTAEFMR